ncbi:Dihydrolipoyl dehydrogenase [Sulfidibacter corallicola]|uniref:Dihydrolipoyl dehydrogenase n=1 Tax=Sulfidibacter corallicola TaxID=2818388 RepID=A0A8A4TUR4_SULCO|nr:dihydrolipoyl dehydrogenase [Sulfidibacter corallicola]QTD53097.1 dihydrolipoyl dehydrogenase [Sulfidibacter corallicola]
MSDQHYDVLVIGSGGGTKISTPASHLGLKAAIVEKDRLGGTCLNRGCIPSKMLIHAAEVAETISTASRYNLRPKGFEVDFEALVQRVSQTIDDESDSILPGYRKNENLHYYHGEARFVGDRTVSVRGKTLSADKVYIATGSRPRIPHIPGLDKVPFLTSTEALRLEKQPKKMIVVGGGYIATELAYYFSALGTDISMVVRSVLLRPEDAQVRAAFHKAFQRHAKVYHEATVDWVTFENGVYKMAICGEGGLKMELEGDALLIATGVVPNSDNLNLAAAGVETRPDGFIRVDDRLRTTAEGVWALGDVAGNFMFRHSVNLEGEYLFRTTIAEPCDEAIDYGAMPHAVFSSPQVAGVGETEDQLQARGADYVVGFRNYAASAMGMALRSEEGFVKILVNRADRKILGCHIIGHEASVLVHQVITLMQMKGTLDDLLATTFIHPALNEIVRNAARDARAKLQA